MYDFVFGGDSVSGGPGGAYAALASEFRGKASNALPTIRHSSLPLVPLHADGRLCKYISRSTTHYQLCNKAYCTEHAWVKDVPGYDAVVSAYQKLAGHPTTGPKYKMLRHSWFVNWHEALSTYEAENDDKLEAAFDAAFRQTKRRRVDGPLDRVKRAVNWVDDQASIAQLAKTALGTSHIDVTETSSSDGCGGGVQCPVCHSNAHRNDNPALVLGCGHALCFACAMKIHRSTCPMCNKVAQFGIKMFSV
jgi:hypothetical protein